MSRFLCVIVPCYNEGESVEGVINAVKSLDNDFDIVVIDDGSTDNTYRTSSSLTTTIKLVKNLGIGGAVQTGIKYVRDNDYDFAVQIDGDGQHLPDQISILLKAQGQTGADLVIGSRYAGDGSFKSTFYRRVGSGVIKQALRIFHPETRISDPTSGMRLMNRKAMELFAKDYPHDFPEPISLLCALQKGLVVKEVGVKMQHRAFGKSSISMIKSVQYIVKVLGFIVIRGTHGTFLRRGKI